MASSAIRGADATAPEAEVAAEAPADRAEAEEGDKTDDVVESEAPAPAKPRKAKAA